MIKFDFAGRVLVVTGGTGNLGRAVAHAAMDAGGRVVVLDRNQSRQAELYGDLDAEQHLAIGGVDMSESASVEAAIAQVIERYGAIDGLIHTVGGFEAGKPLHETSIEVWESMIQKNARTAFVVCRAVLPHMLARRSGKIVTVGAMAGRKGGANLAGYAASKAAVINLTETLSAEVRPYGINVNCVLPGTIDTPENRASMPDADFSRWIAPESLAAAILYLCSEAARDVHGVALAVEGQG